MKRVLVPTIGTPGCRKAEAQGVELARGGGAVRFLYVADAKFFQEIPRSLRHDEGADHDMEVIGRLILDRAVADALEAGVVAETALVHGNVADEIVKAAKVFRATDIVISREKRGFLARHIPAAKLASMERETGARFEVIDA